MEFKVTANHLINAFQDALFQIQAYVQEEVPIGKTGNLRRAINASNVLYKGGILSGYVFIDPSGLEGANYGIYVHEGTGIYGIKGIPFVVKASRAKALSFNWNGEHFLRKSVTIQGQKPNPFFDRTFSDYNQQKASVINAFFEQAIINNIVIIGGTSGKT